MRKLVYVEEEEEKSQNFILLIQIYWLVNALDMFCSVLIMWTKNIYFLCFGIMKIEIRFSYKKSFIITYYIYYHEKEVLFFYFNNDAFVGIFYLSLNCISFDEFFFPSFLLLVQSREKLVSDPYEFGAAFILIYSQKTVW